MEREALLRRMEKEKEMEEESLLDDVRKPERWMRNASRGLRDAGLLAQDVRRGVMGAPRRIAEELTPATIAKMWKLRVGKHWWLDVLTFVIAVLISAVCPATLLITLIVALYQGWGVDSLVVASPFVGWIAPLVILILTVLALIMIPWLYVRTMNFFSNPAPIKTASTISVHNTVDAAGRVVESTYHQAVNTLSGVLGTATIATFVIELILYVAIFVMVIIWLVYAAYLNPVNSTFSLFWPWEVAGRTYDLSRCMLALNIVGLIWVFLIALHFIVCIAYIARLVWVWALLNRNPNMDAGARIGYFLATAKASKLKARAGLSN